MTRQEHLLTILAEECAEVAQRATKALRFGMDEAQPGQPYTNEQRLEEELCHLVAAWEMLQGCPIDIDGGNLRKLIEYKKAKVEIYLAYSQECGTLQV